MSTHVYSSYVNILDLHIGHVGSEVQKIFNSIVGTSRSGRATLPGVSPVADLER